MQAYISRIKHIYFEDISFFRRHLNLIKVEKLNLTIRKILIVTFSSFFANR